MRIIFNWLALLEYGICFVGALIVDRLLRVTGFNRETQQLISKVVGIIFVVLVMIVGDFLYRFSRVKRANEKVHKVLYPNRGGHIFFIPSFVLGIVFYS